MNNFEMDEVGEDMITRNMNNFELDDKAEDLIIRYTPYYIAKQLLLCQEELKETQASLAKQVERNNRLYTDMVCLAQQRTQTYD